MAALARDRRRELEGTVRAARRAAEAGARKILEQYAVQRREPWESMTAEDRALRNRLRAHGRQLGDQRETGTGAQEIDRLVQECAYEHWHRMLFARFLAEADLLIEPESGVAVTLDEVRELARERGADWLALAGGYAGRMLPRIFRADDPVLAIALPPETRRTLEDLLKSLPCETFIADDGLGWVYQFWQADRKKAVNEAGGKIGADELPVVTQLFTEDYMVLFLLHNTLGAWWAGKVLRQRPGLAESAESEDELRAACAPAGVAWTYLRFVRDEGDDGTQGPWRPAAGGFAGWPEAANDITLLDPCMGSGHFLVAALPLLAALRVAEEELSHEEAIVAVLRDNLFGLEIDPRCTQIAAFNLAFAAWKAAGHRPLPPLNLACSGLAIGVGKAEWLRLAEKAAAAAGPDAKRNLFGTEDTLLTVGVEERVKNGLAALHDLFARAPWLGSLIDPRRVGGDIFHEGFDRLAPLLALILAAADTDESREMAVAARGMATAAALLGRRFTLVATNVPFLGRGKQHATMRNYLESHFKDARADLATAMLRRLTGFAARSGDRCRGHAAELAVPQVLREAAQTPAAGDDLERRRGPRSARVRDHQRRSREHRPGRGHGIVSPQGCSFRRSRRQRGRGCGGEGAHTVVRADSVASTGSAARESGSTDHDWRRRRRPTPERVRDRFPRHCDGRFLAVWKAILGTLVFGRSLVATIHDGGKYD